MTKVKTKKKSKGRDRYERLFESSPKEREREAVIDRYMDALYEFRLATCSLHWHSAEQDKPSRCAAEYAMEKIEQIELHSNLRLKPEKV